MRAETSIEIDAPPTAVWDVMVDVERWSEWTASITRVERLDEGPFGVGSRARVKQPRLPAAIWEVTEIEPGVVFTWTAVAPGVRSTGIHRVTPRGGDRSTAVLTFAQEGPLGGLAGALFGGMIRRYVRMEAEGLKRRSEGG